MPLSVKLFTRRGCHLCDSTRVLLDRLRAEFDFTLETIDIDCDAELKSSLGCSIPVVTINGGNRVALRVDEDRLRRALIQAQTRADSNEASAVL